MNYDGSFEKGLYSGLKTFQYEHKDSHKLSVTGKLDPVSADLIKKLSSQGNFSRPGIKIDLSKLPSGKFCGYAKIKPAKPERFYQLPPSINHLYKRYGTPSYNTKGELGDVYHNDIWGSSELIAAIIKLSEQWKSENDILEIGDIAAWNAVNIGHAGHRDGFGIDIRTNKCGRMNTSSYKFDKSKSVNFLKKAKDLGFHYILTLCPHVTQECNSSYEKKPAIYVNQISNHEHHYHMDFWKTGSTIRDAHLSRGYCKNCEWKNSCKSKHKLK